MRHTYPAMRSRRFWLTTAVLWLAFGLISGTQIWISMITHGHSTPVLIGYYVLIWFAWFGNTVLIVMLSRRWPIVPPKLLHIGIHVLAAFAVAVLHIAIWTGAMLVLKPFDPIQVSPGSISLREVLSSRLLLELLLYAVVLGVVQAIDYYEKYRAAQLSLHEARLHALELQLQPHFLFNTLNSVSSLVRIGKADDAVRMIAMLSDLLRYTLDRAGAQRVTLEEEVATLRRYFDIQRVRFSDRLTLDIDVAEEVKHVPVPTFILQPLAENAIRHGISRSAGEGRIEVRAARENENVRIEMFNTGSLSDAHRQGVGLANTIARLQQIYGAAHRFTLAPANGGVLAVMSIPWSEPA
ncbi:MAG TPA: histidine kinase [Thermoanaerobaculia bacterium]|nr:histidine kinase [Thermoanaerobaculia bacterium]